MVWIEFLISAGLITLAAMQLAKSGDIIANRTRMGGMIIGIVLLAGATSLPELLTTISAIFQGVPNLAAGNLLGSNMLNMFLLAVLDMVNYKRRLLRKAALRHALSGSLATLLIGMVVFFILADINIKIGWVGGDSILLILAYLVAVNLLRGQSRHLGAPAAIQVPDNYPSLRQGLIGFVLAAAALTVITPWMVNSSSRIADLTGLGATFIGTTLVALVTSLPELVTTLAAAKLGADDMAIGNLFGSNMFNMFALGLTDLFYLQGRFLSVIDPAFLLVGMLGLLMTGMGLIGNLARLERRLFIIEMDALALILVYLSGLWFLYSRGAG